MKIQKKKGFMKGREDKAKLLKQSKTSKTAKRNSKAPMSDIVMSEASCKIPAVVPNDQKSPGLQDIVTVSHDGAWREEIEIELRDLNEESYNGTIAIFMK